MKIERLFRDRLVYKIAALLLAVTTYVYVRGEIGVQGIGFREQNLLKNVTSKIIPVKVALKGEPPQGYKILKSGIKIMPEKVIIIGKKDDLKQISEVATKEIDVRKFTHTETVSVSLVPLDNAINVSSKMIEVEVPVMAVR